jgi:hypothetical protein
MVLLPLHLPWSLSGWKQSHAPDGLMFASSTSLDRRIGEKFAQEPLPA